MVRVTVKERVRRSGGGRGCSHGPWPGVGACGPCDGYGLPVFRALLPWTRSLTALPPRVAYVSVFGSRPARPCHYPVAALGGVFTTL